MAKCAPSPPSDDQLLPSLPALPLSNSHWQAIFDSFGISPKQRRIVRLLLRSAGTKEIAIALEMSEAAVKTHIQRVFGRLNVNDRMGIALCVLKASHEVRSPISCQPNGRHAGE